MNPRTIPSRVDCSKLAPNIRPNKKASSTIERAVQLFEELGGEILQIPQGETSFRSTTQKKHDEDARKKAARND